MKRYVEASPRARQWLFLVAVVWAGLVLFASRFSTYFPLPTGAQELLAEIDARALYGLVALSLFYLALPAMAVFVAIRVVRTRQWPPAGMANPISHSGPRDSQPHCGLALPREPAACLRSARCNGCIHHRGHTFHAARSVASGRPKAVAMSPNPSIERTLKSRPRYSTSSLLLPRGLLSVAAHVKR